MNKNNVKILKGLFRGKIGELYKTFKHNGQTLHIVRMYHAGEATRDPAFYYSCATVADGEFEYVD